VARPPGRDPIALNRRWWNAGSDAYQEAHAVQLGRVPMAWGVWSIPEAELGVLGDVGGLDVLEFGCGAALWSIALARSGARVVGLDLSERQLGHARRNAAASGVAVRLVQADGERAPFAAASFDVVFCDHGVTSWARPERTIAEAARLLRPGGRLAFNIASPLRDLCWDPSNDQTTPRLVNDYFGLHAFDEGDCIGYQLGYGAWIRLFRRLGLVVEDLLELRPPDGAGTTYADYVPLDWARRWPAENIWKLRKPRC
jgi:SAM-dependent methyltransferase